MFDFLFGKPQKPRPETEEERFSRLMAEASRARAQLGLPPVDGIPAPPVKAHGAALGVRVQLGYGDFRAGSTDAGDAALNLVTAGCVDLSLAVTEREWMSRADAQSLHVWLHVNGDGSPFYIGRGRGDRAWRAHGGYAWECYVRDVLGGAYHVVIAASGLDDPRSEALVSAGLEANQHLMLKLANPFRRYDSAKAALRAGVREKDEELFAVIERTSDASDRARLALEGIELQIQGAAFHGETGRWGEVLKRAGALQYGDRYYLRVAVESLVELGQVHEAKATIERVLTELPWLRHGTETERLQKVIERGTFRRRGSKRPPRGPEQRWGAN